MEALLGRLAGSGYELHALSNYPSWFQLIEEKLQLSRYLSWTFVSCTGPMEVRPPGLQPYFKTRPLLNFVPGPGSCSEPGSCKTCFTNKAAKRWTSTAASAASEQRGSAAKWVAQKLGRGWRSNSALQAARALRICGSVLWASACTPRASTAFHLVCNRDCRICRRILEVLSWIVGWCFFWWWPGRLMNVTPLECAAAWSKHSRASRLKKLHGRLASNPPPPSPPHGTIGSLIESWPKVLLLQVLSKAFLVDTADNSLSHLPLMLYANAYGTRYGHIHIAQVCYLHWASADSSNGEDECHTVWACCCLIKAQPR